MWRARLRGDHGAALTPLGAEFVRANAPKRKRDDIWNERPDTLGVHLLDGVPWLSWQGRLVGMMKDSVGDDGCKAMLEAVDLTKWHIELPGVVGIFNRNDNGVVVGFDNEDTSDWHFPTRGPMVIYSRPTSLPGPEGEIHNGPRNLTWFAQNPVPPGRAALLPTRATPLSVNLDEGALQKLQPYINQNTSSSLYATLHGTPPKTSRSGPMCQVQVDGIAVGQLSPQAAANMAPVVDYLVAQGRVPTVWAILSTGDIPTDNSMSIKLSIYTQLSHELDESWITSPDYPQCGPSD